MAIKSKNSRKVKIVKRIAAILALCMGAMTLFSAALFTFASIDYCSSEFSVVDLASRTKARNAGTVYFDTDLGHNDIRNALYALNEIVTQYGDDDYFYNTYLPQRSAQIEQEYQENMEAFIQQSISEHADCGTEGHDTREYWEQSYYEQSDSPEQQIQYVENDYTRYKTFLEGFFYYAVDPDTGFVYTNVTDESPTDVIAQLPYAARYDGKTGLLEKKMAAYESSTEANDAANVETTSEPATQPTDLSREIGTMEPAQTETPRFVPIESFVYDMELTADCYIGFDYDSVRSNPDWNSLIAYSDAYAPYKTVYWFEQVIGFTSTIVPLAAVCAVIFALSLAAALACAGRGPLPEAGTEEYRRKVERFGGTISGREPVLRNVLDAIPNDLHLILSAGLLVLGAVCSVTILYEARYDITDYGSSPFYLLELAICFAASAVFLELCMSISRNAKTGRYWNRTVLAAIGRGFRRMGRWFKCQFSPLGYHFKSLPRYILRLLIAYFVVMIPLSLIPFLPIFINIFVVLFLWRSMASLDRLMKYAHEIQSGNLDVTIDTSKFPKWMVPFADDIIHLRDGMQAAVDEALRSERLKTELITNVSHDLKTPLTSIINYTGLLAKCDIPDPQARDYIAVLQNKSDRLKHLIEDLVEASKASTGNVEFHPVRLNLYEMAVQAVGENEDALANQGVTVVINTPQEQPVVWADSQKTWRVVENLLSNVRKYSVPGTRAYIDVHTEGAFGMLTVKNISREELNISPEELMERFVRGDESRSTEGSGLGLSIAQNLCEKQGGTFRIDIDGDLFKDTVRLPLAPVQPAPAAAPLPDGLEP